MRYNPASAKDAPPNLCISHGLGLPLGEVTLAGQISAEGIFCGGGLLNDTPSGDSLLLLVYVDGCWLKKPTL